MAVPPRFLNLQENQIFVYTFEPVYFTHLNAQQKKLCVLKKMTTD